MGGGGPRRAGAFERSGGPGRAGAVNATVISLDEAPQGYEDFDKGAAKKFVFNPHGLVKA